MRIDDPHIFITHKVSVERKSIHTVWEYFTRSVVPVIKVNCLCSGQHLILWDLFPVLWDRHLSQSELFHLKVTLVVIWCEHQYFFLFLAQIEDMTECRVQNGIELLGRVVWYQQIHDTVVCHLSNESLPTSHHPVSSQNTQI